CEAHRGLGTCDGLYLESGGCRRRQGGPWFVRRRADRRRAGSLEGRRATMSLQTLRDNRAVLLACEAIGWVHMAGKAHPEFLRGHGGQSNGYDFKKWASSWSPDWNTRLAWLSSNNTLT